MADAGSGGGRGPARGLISKAYAEFFLEAGGLSLFSNFFLWSFGTGALQLARPLFAASFGVPVFLVSLVTASNAVSKVFAAPITGVLMDRWGRKPLLIFGVILRGITALLEFYADSYIQFFVLEFIGGIGVSIWATGSNILIADLSGPHNRGMAVATRGFSNKLGMMLGPIAGGVLAVTLGLRSIFMFNALMKLVQLGMLIWATKESRPDDEPIAVTPPKTTLGVDWSLYWNRPFLAVAVATLAVSIMTQGVFQSVFPVFTKDVVRLDDYDIGSLMTMAGVVSLLVSFPNGWLVDRFGRRASLTPGLLVLGFSALMLAMSNSYWSVALFVGIYGLGEGMGNGSSQAAAMDLAPASKRGAFLGVWSLLQNAGTVVAATAIGAAADIFGYGPTFEGTGVAMAICAALFWVTGASIGRSNATDRRTSAVPAVAPLASSPGGSASVR